MKKIRLVGLIYMSALICLTTAISAGAQTYRALVNIDPTTTGEYPVSPLVQGFNGNLYGVAIAGGANGGCGYGNSNNCGTFFEVTPSGKFTVIYNFCSLANCAEGGLPEPALALGPDGNFYGSTYTGGANNVYPCEFGVAGCGTIFKVTPSGHLTTLYNFCSELNCADGLYPNPLVLGADGNFYGTTESGGILNGDAGCPSGCGTVFKISPSGQFTSLYKFCTTTDINGDCTDGIIPVSGMVQAGNGNFYGTTLYGGTSGRGNIFQVTPSGVLTPMYSFCSQANCIDGILGLNEPFIVGGDGNLYSTTNGGGVNRGGTFYRFTLKGELTTLYSFCFSQTSACPDGTFPYGSLAQGSDGNFYGATSSGGNTSPVLCGGVGYGCGTLFQISPAGQLTTLYRFCPHANCIAGAYAGGVMQATNGAIYGTTTYGGSLGSGVIFGATNKLGAFVRALPNVGPAGRPIDILGNNLAGTTSVTFNGASATYQVVSNTYLKAQVPAGATTGTIQVTTPSGVLSSNVAFQVLP